MRVLRYPIYYINVVLYKVYFTVIGLLRKGRKNIFVYTDSRGYDVNDWRCKKNPRNSYIMKLLGKYKITAKICEYKHTTLLDFIDDVKGVDFTSYDYLVLHVGVVDFSPRPLKSAIHLHKLKSEKVIRCFGVQALADFELAMYPEKYKGEETASLYGLIFLEKYIIPFVNSLNVKVVWIPVNRVDAEWAGNYTGSRPVNMNVIMQYQELIDGYAGNFIVPKIVNSNDDIKRLTVDNIHFSSVGMEEIFDVLNTELGDK